MNEMLIFVKFRQKEGDFGRFVDIVGEQTAFVVATEILSWLKRQKRFRHEKELELNSEHTWSQKLPMLLGIDLSLDRLFEIVESRMRFRLNIELSERTRIRDLSDGEYRPVVRP